MRPTGITLVATITLINYVIGQSRRDPITNEICPDLCEPEKCPNLGPIGLSQCPAEQYIVTYRCGCCKKCDIRPVTTTVSAGRRDEVCKKMTCPRKKACVLNIQGLPVCKCPSEDFCIKALGAKKKLAVCGSDGNTYPSRCHLKVASCASDGKIRVKGKGQCKPSQTKQGTPSTIKSFTNKNNNRAGRKQGKRKQHPHGHQSSRNRKLEGRGGNRRSEKKQNKRQNRKREKNYQRALRSAIYRF